MAETRKNPTGKVRPHRPFPTTPGMREEEQSFLFKYLPSTSRATVKSEKTDENFFFSLFFTSFFKLLWIIYLSRKRVLIREHKMDSSNGGNLSDNIRTVASGLFEITI